MSLSWFKSAQGRTVIATALSVLLGVLFDKLISPIALPVGTFVGAMLGLFHQWLFATWRSLWQNVKFWPIVWSNKPAPANDDPHAKLWQFNAVSGVMMFVFGVLFLVQTAFGLSAMLKEMPAIVAILTAFFFWAWMQCQYMHHFEVKEDAEANLTTQDQAHMLPDTWYETTRQRGLFRLALRRLLSLITVAIWTGMTAVANVLLMAFAVPLWLLTVLGMFLLGICNTVYWVSKHSTAYVPSAIVGTLIAMAYAWWLMPSYQTAWWYELAALAVGAGAGFGLHAGLRRLQISDDALLKPVNRVERKIDSALEVIDDGFSALANRRKQLIARRTASYAQLV